MHENAIYELPRFKIPSRNEICKSASFKTPTKMVDSHSEMSAGI